MGKQLRWSVALVAGLGLVSAVGCKKSSDDDDSDESSVGRVVPGGGKGNGVSGNVLSGAFPSELAIAAFPQTTSASLSLEGSVEDPNADKSITEKVDDNERRLGGEGDCLDAAQFKNFKMNERVTCYEFDSEMEPYKRDGETDREFGTIDGTNGAGEACMVTYARQEMEDVSQKVDRALAVVAGMLCKAKQDDGNVSLPAEGEVLDLAASFAGAADGVGLDVSAASMTRLADVNGNAVYRSDVTIVTREGDEDEIHLVHSPAEDGSSAGTLWMKRPTRKAADGPAVDPNNEANKSIVISINYAKTLEDGRERMTAELRRAAIVNTIEPFSDAGLVAFENVADDAMNDTIHAMKYVAFDMYPDTAEGRLSYWANPGGRLTESARGFLFDMSLADDGMLTGCGVSGATADVSIRNTLAHPSADNVLEPVRFWHPGADRNVHADKDDRYVGKEGAFITEQCFKQNADGVYAIDTDKTAHERGYEVIAQDAVDVLPPPPPPTVLDGEFKPE